MRRSSLALLMLLAIGCATDGVVEPNLTRAEVAGAYRLSALTFDPQGSLGMVDIRARLLERGKPDPSLSLIDDGTAQLLFEDPGSSLLRLVQGTYRTTPTGVTIDLGSVASYTALLLPRTATYERFGDGSFGLEYSGGVSRAALIALVPEWEQEPLLDPMPGMLQVTLSPAD